MPVLALVATLAEDSALARATCAALAADPRFALGPVMGQRLPLAATTEDRREASLLLDALEALPGVRLLELVMADYSDTDAEAPSTVPAGACS